MNKMYIRKRSIILDEDYLSPVENKKQRLPALTEQKSRVIFRSFVRDETDYSLDTPELTLEPESSSASEFDPREFTRRTYSNRKKDEDNYDKKKKKLKSIGSRQDLKERRVEQRKEKSRNAAQKRRNLESSIILVMQINLAHIMRGKFSPFHQTDKPKLDQLREAIIYDSFEDYDLKKINECLNTTVAASCLEKSAVIKLTGQALFFFRHLENSLGLPMDLSRKLQKLPSVETCTFMFLLVDMSTMTVAYATPSLANTLGWPWINLIGANLSDILPFRCNQTSRINALKRITNIESNLRANIYQNNNIVINDVVKDSLIKHFNNTSDQQNNNNNSNHSFQIDRYWCSNLYRQSSTKRSSFVHQKANHSDQQRHTFDNNFYMKNIILDCWYETSMQSKFLRPMKMYIFRSQPLTLSNAQIKIRLLEKELQEARQSSDDSTFLSNFKTSLSSQFTSSCGEYEENQTSQIIESLNFINDEDEFLKDSNLLIILNDNFDIVYSRNTIGESSDPLFKTCIFDHVHCMDLEILYDQLDKIKSGERISSRFPNIRLHIGNKLMRFSGTMNILNHKFTPQSSTTAFSIILTINPIMESNKDSERMPSPSIKSRPISIQTSNSTVIKPEFPDINKPLATSKKRSTPLASVIRQPRKQYISIVNMKENPAKSIDKTTPSDKVCVDKSPISSQSESDSLLTSGSDLIDSLILSNDIEMNITSPVENYDLDFFNIDSICESNDENEIDIFAASKDFLTEHHDNIWLQPMA